MDDNDVVETAGAMCDRMCEELYKVCAGQPVWVAINALEACKYSILAESAIFAESTEESSSA